MIALEAARRGLSAVLAARTPGSIDELALRTGYPRRYESLRDPLRLADMIDDTSLVINCAGPFADTYGPLLLACRMTGTDYVDISGEVDVLDTILAASDKLRHEGIRVIPGAGFDVVPTDALSMMLADSMPDAEKLTLAVRPSHYAFTHGTLRAAFAGMADGVKYRSKGEIKAFQFRGERMPVIFDHKIEMAMPASLGDVASAYYSTGIENITTWTELDPASIDYLALMSPMASLTRNRFLRELGWRWASMVIQEPDREALQEGETLIFGRVTSSDGRVNELRMRTPNGYTLSSKSAIETAVRLLDSDSPPGAFTPAQAFGPRLATDIAGVDVFE